MATILAYPQDEVDRIKRALLEYSTRDSYRGNEFDRVWDWDRWSWLADWQDEERRIVDVPGLGRVRVLPTYTGGEKGPEDTLIVFHITEPNGNELYLRKDGYYYSYDGTNWDGSFYQVSPVEVKVTEYQAVKA